MNVQTAGGRFEVEPSVSNHFAWIRTRLSIERTFMAWIRTAISLIGFGFTIVTFISHIQSLGVAPVRHPAAARDLGLSLIAAGIAATGAAAWQYVWGYRYLWRADFRSLAGIDDRPHLSPSMFCAGTVMLIGVFAFATVFFRL